MKSCISINLRKEDIVIKINEEFSHEDIMYALRKKIPELKKLYQSEKTPIVITGKVLKNKEIDEIQALIKKYIDVEIEFDMPKSLGLSSITRTFKQEIAISETKFHRGSLRSGQKIEFEGSLVILGDVNDGAEVIAGENIVVGDWKKAIILYAIVIVAVAIIIFFINKFDKDKVTGKALETIK